MQRRAILVALAAAVGASGCGEEATGPTDGLAPEEVEALAPQFDEAGTEVIDAFAFGLWDPVLSVRATGAAGVPRESRGEFSRTATCPAGGEVSVEGSWERSVDREARSMTAAFEAARAHHACAFRVRGSLVTLDGDPEVRTEATRRIEAGALVEAVTTHRGAFTYSRGEASGRCEVDLRSEFDPEERTITVSGTFCGREIDRTRPWRHPRRG